MQRFGIDVSKWQGNFNFAQAKKEGVEFVIIKAGGADGGLYTDYMFLTNYNAARAAGLQVGTYFYFDAYNNEQADKQTDYFMSIIRGKKFEYPVFGDFEDKMIQQPKDKLEAIVRRILSKLETSGYWCGWYAGLEMYYWHVNGASLAAKYSWWLPYWGSSKPKLDGIQMWQFGGDTNYIRANKVAGVICDQDYCYVDYPTLIKQRGKNGYPKTATSTVPSAPKTETPKATLEKGKKIKLKSTATIYGTKDRFDSYVYKTTYYIREINGAKHDRVVFAPKMTGGVTGAVAADQVTLVG